jgi:hypothetical protein
MLKFLPFSAKALSVSAEDDVAEVCALLGFYAE